METIILYELNGEQTEAYEEAKRQVIHECGRKEVDDFMILQFCRAKQFDITKAVQAYKENRAWRFNYNVEKLLEDYTAPKVLQMYFPLYILGLDREGSPILVFELGTTDINGLNNCVSVDEITKHVIFILEVGEKYMNDNLEDSKKQRWLVIIDCKEFPPVFGTNKSFRQTAKNMAEMCGKNYPERLKSVIIINASPIIHVLVKFVKQFVPETVIDKLTIYDETGWEDHLQGVIDSNVLPQYLGGTLTDFSTFAAITPIVRGDKIPKDLFLDTKRGYLKSNTGVTEYTLSRSETYKIEVPVSTANTYLKWEFETDTHSVGFGLQFTKDEGSKPTILIPSKRIYAINRTESGEYMCEETGTYLIVFDNSFSRFTTKKLYYKYALWT